MPGANFAPRPSPPEEPQYVRIDVAGLTESVWHQFRGQFVTRLRELVAKLAIESRNDFFQDKADQLTAPMLQQAVEQIAKQPPSANQIKAFDRVVKAFAKRPRRPPVEAAPGQTLEQTRFERIEAARAALLGLLECTRVCLGPDEALLIGNNIDALVDLVKMVGPAS
jgi:hypothetical protein